MFRKFIANTCLTTLIALGPVMGQASDQALYGTAIPDDAVFVRWLDTPAQATVFGVPFDANLAAGTDYLPISAQYLPDVPQGGFYSVIGTALVQEPARDDLTKVHVILLNTDESPARIVLAGGTAEVIGETAQNSAAARAVNPVKATLAVMQGETLLGEFDVALRRGQNVTFFVQDGTVQFIKNGFAPVAEPN